MCRIISAVARIQGDKVTTFDGTSYDLTKSCTFLLARDNVDGNFTVVLHKEDNNKTLIVIAGGRSIELFQNGQVRS